MKSNDKLVKTKLGLPQVSRKFGQCLLGLQGNGIKPG